LKSLLEIVGHKVMVESDEKDKEVNKKFKYKQGKRKQVTRSKRKQVSTLRFPTFPNSLLTSVLLIYCKNQSMLKMFTIIQ